MNRSIVATLILVGLLGPAARAQDVSDIVEFEVSLQVENINRSQLPCPSDGASYQVVGDLATPARGASAVTLYIHGAAGNHYGHGAAQGIDDIHDLPARMAERGHASFALDQLGYGRSDKPDGLAMCLGSQADIAHQVITALRSGAYQVDGEPGPAFEHVTLAGHSMGGWVAELEAYSFMDVDGLIVLDDADLPNVLPWGVPVVAHFASTCAQGGEVRPYYTYSWATTEDMANDVTYDAEPEVRALFIARAEPDPCGNGSVGALLALDQAMIATIDVPVLVLDAEFSMSMRGPYGELQCARYQSAPACSLITIPETGHMLWLERRAADVYSALDWWLNVWGGES